MGWLWLALLRILKSVCICLHDFHHSVVQNVQCILHQLVFIAEKPFVHLVKTLVINDVDYKYFDVTSIEPSYGEFH